MSPRVRHILLDVNRRFYDHHAAAFGATRQRPWPGWTRVLEHAPAEGPCLDIGCGNGRFCGFLDTQDLETRPYLGIDSSLRLLVEARGSLRRCSSAGPGPRARWVLGDVASGREPLSLATPQALVAVFGVLHHIPGETWRRELLARLLRGLAPAGLLAATVWRLDRAPRFGKRRVPWGSYAAACGKAGLPVVDEGELEPGDHLLDWSADPSVPRYCHFPTDDEVQRLTEHLKSLGATLVDRFLSDGPSGEDNLYLLFRKAPSC